MLSLPRPSNCQIVYIEMRNIPTKCLCPGFPFPGRPSVVHLTLELPQSNAFDETETVVLPTSEGRKTITLFGNVINAPSDHYAPKRSQRPHKRSDVEELVLPHTDSPVKVSPLPVKSKRAVAYVERDNDTWDSNGSKKKDKRSQLPPLPYRQVQMRTERRALGHHDAREEALYSSFKNLRGLPFVDIDRGVCTFIGIPVLKHLEESRQLFRWYPLGMYAILSSLFPLPLQRSDH